MGSMSRFISAAKAAVGDERLRWRVYYVAVFMAGITC